MKIIGDNFDIEENILKLISKSNPSSDVKLTFKNISEMAGWVYVKGSANEAEFSINFSSVVFDISIFIQFFSELINLKDDVALFLDYEGSYPLLYAKKIDKNTLRFIFAHDYILFKNNANYEDCLNYKIEFDTLINKKDLLGKFYVILHLFLKDYDEKFAHESGFTIKKAKRYRDKIKSYLDKNLNSEEMKTIEETIKEKSSVGLGEYTKEMLKPENLIGPFETTEEMMKSLLEDED